MSEFVDITVDDIAEINESIIGIKTKLNDAFAGYKASIEYIDSIKEKIASAVVSIARNHSFKDGNKRTAVSIYYTLCELNNIIPKDTIQDIILDIVNNHMNYKEAVEILFDEDKKEVEESVAIKSSEEYNKYNLDIIIKIITEETTMTSDYLYDNADAYNYIELEGLYPQQVDDFLTLFTFNPETLEKIEKRIIEEADIKKNKKADNIDNISSDISTLESLLDEGLFSQEAITGVQNLIDNLNELIAK